MLVFILLLMSCNSENENLKEFLEEKPWIQDSLKSIPCYYSNGIEFTVRPKDRKGVNIQSGVYLYKDSPNKPKANSVWNKYSYYKFSNDTLYMQPITSEDVSIRHLKMVKDMEMNIK